MRRLAIALIALALASVLIVPAYAQEGPYPETVVHIVQQGETLLSITRRYRVTIDAVTHVNGLSDPRHIYVGQRLVIPGAERLSGEVETVPYVVVAGDTLTSVARRYSTTWQKLAEINRLVSPNVSYVGQVMQVPALDVTPATGAMAMRGGMPYVVRSGDTLFAVAVRHDVSRWDLAAASHVANPSLTYVGQELLIPGEGPGLLPEPFLYVEVRPLPVPQGTTLVIEVHTTEPVVVSGSLFGQEVRFAEEGGVHFGLAGVHVFADPGLYELVLTAEDGQAPGVTLATGVLLEAGRFGYERIPASGYQSSLLDPAIVAAERERLEFATRTFSPDRGWEGPFRRPCVGTVSSFFGTRRSYGSGPYTSYHDGLDLRAPTGTPVYAAAAGTVTLAELTAIHGNMIVLDHGWGVLTGYAHLSSIGVEVGQHVDEGELIGKVGNTGLSTGSHLHWQVWVGGTSVDGRQWLEGLHTWSEAGG